MAPDRMWDLLIEGSDEMADELGLEEPTPAFAPGSLGVIDGWIRDHDGALDEDEVTRLGLYLARVLVETHGGGLAVIHQKDHPLDGEWAITGFARSLANDYHVPFLVSAVRVGVDRSLTAKEWYQRLLQEGRAARAVEAPEPAAARKRAQRAPAGRPPRR